VKGRMKKYIVFGISPILSDIFDIIHANNGKIYKIYKNMPELKKERDMGVRERIDLLGYPVKTYDSLDHFEPEKGCSYIIGTPSPQKYRLIEEMKEKYSLSFSTLIHPTVTVGSHVHIGEGVTINVQTVIGPNAYLDDFCFLNRCCSLGHEAKIGKYTLLSPGVTVGGATHIADKCSLGMNAIIFDGLYIGDWAIIGAGSLVNKDMPRGVIAYGAPAKIIRENEEVDFFRYKAKRGL
jgi:sugar O-acyltransferase (sialic acid O-acetyltransferase NeuD family)